MLESAGVFPSELANRTSLFWLRPAMIRSTWADVASILADWKVILIYAGEEVRGIGIECSGGWPGSSLARGFVAASNSSVVTIRSINHDAHIDGLRAFFIRATSSGWFLRCCSADRDHAMIAKL